jgi:hypothetical protein
LATFGSPSFGVHETAHEDRRMRLLHRLGSRSRSVEVGELAVVLEDVVRPDALHDLDRLAHVGVPLGEDVVALAASNSSGIQPAPTPTLTRPFERWSIVAISAARTRRVRGTACR